MNADELNAIESRVSQIVNEHLDLIVIDAKGLAEAKQRAAKFLVVQSILSTFLKTFEDDLARQSTLTEAQYAQGISGAEGKNVTEKKINMALYTDYTNAREFHERLDSLRSWIKTHMKIFENAHLLFRQYSRE